MMDSNSLPLHDCHGHKLWANLNRTYALLNFLALGAIFYYRVAYFLNKNGLNYYVLPSLAWFAVFAAELFFSFLWILKQSIFWRPVTRTAFPERLPGDDDLPGIDVFVCTADPNKEPTFRVMNTVISAMALDYPAEKLSVYLSDDGGAYVTLEGMKEAWAFATWWLPFCRRYNVKSICPQAYFDGPEEVSMSKEFIKDRQVIKEQYEIFKHRVQSKRRRSGDVNGDAKTFQDHPALIQVIDGESIEDDDGTLNPEHTEMPLLVYVAREKRPSHPHHFKAGATNVLLRVSSKFSNSPCILVLDCDMYCNNSTSARQAMCFYLDPKISQSLAWVQYPQKFHNISESDVYDSQMRTVWSVWWPGADGLQGPVISGTNCYIKRRALYDTDLDDGNNLRKQNNSSDPSNDYIKSLSHFNKPNGMNSIEKSSVFLQEAQLLASCTYERGTKWGDKVGFHYDTVTEDVMTSLVMQTKGWRSVYLNPVRPQFLGSAATNLNEILIQGIRWYSGLLASGLSKYFPLIQYPSKMQFLQKMKFSWLIMMPLESFPALCFATISPLCLLHGIPLYPKVSDPFSIAFAFVFISSHLKHLYEVYISGGSVKAWLNEHRFWMIRTVTSYIYGTLECFMNKLSLRKASFVPTNKVGDDDKTNYYLQGKYDFRTSNMFLIPLATIVSLNLACFVGGFARVIITRNQDAMFVQMCFSVYVLAMSFPVIAGMVLRTDEGRIPPSSTLISMAITTIVLCLGYRIFSY